MHPSSCTSRQQSSRHLFSPFLMSPTASDDIILSRHNKKRTNGRADKCLSEDGCIFSLSSFDEYSVSLRYIQYSIQNQHGNNQKELNISGTETLKIKPFCFFAKFLWFLCCLIMYPPTGRMPLLLKTFQLVSLNAGDRGSFTFHRAHLLLNDSLRIPVSTRTQIRLGISQLLYAFRVQQMASSKTKMKKKDTHSNSRILIQYLEKGAECLVGNGWI